MKLVSSLLILVVLLGQAWATTGKIKTYEEITRIDNWRMDPSTKAKTHFAFLLGIVTLDSGQVYNVVWEDGPFKLEEQVKRVLKEMSIDPQDTIRISDKKVSWCAAEYVEGQILHKKVAKKGRILIYGPFDTSHVLQMGQELTLTGKQMVNEGGLVAQEYLKVFFEDFNFNPLTGDWRLNNMMFVGQKWQYCGPYVFWGGTHFLFKRGALKIELSQK